MLTEKQSRIFIEFYRDLYNVKKGDPIPHISVKDEPKHEKIWRKQVRKMLGKKAKELYKYRSYGKQTREDRIFQELRLQYGPILDFDEAEKESNKKILFKEILDNAKNLFSKFKIWKK